MEKLDSQNWTIYRTLTKPLWSATKSIIEYTEDYLYQETGGATEPSSDYYQTLNYAALQGWYEMNNKPRYWYAWSALSQISNIMYNSPMLNLYYSYNAFNYVW